MQTQGVSSRGRGVSPEGCAAKWSAPCWPPLEGKLWWCDDVMLWWGPARASAAVLSGRPHFPTCAKVQTMTQSMGEGNAGTQLATSTLAPVSQGWKHAPRRGSASHCYPPSPQLLPRREPRAPSAAQLSSPSRSGGRERNGGCVWSTQEAKAFSARLRLTQPGKWLSPRGDRSWGNLMRCAIVLDRSGIGKFVTTLSCLWDAGKGIYSLWVSELSIKWETEGNLYGSKFCDCIHQPWNTLNLGFITQKQTKGPGRIWWK